jgi:lysozyme
MKTNAAGLSLIRQAEGLRLRAYPDPGTGGKPWTIGIGTTVYPSGRPVQRGDTCTAQQADAYLAHDLQVFERAVAEMVRVPLTGNQFAALVSLAYNIGAQALRGSTLLRLLNAGDYAGAANQFPRWNRAAGRVLAGLTRRRAAERDLFLSADSAPQHAVGLLAATDIPTPEDKPVLPVLAALLPTIVGMIPTLTKVFTDGTSVTDRNIVVAQKVGELIVDATNSTNLQQAVETMQKDPEALQAATAAVQAQMYELVEAGGGGIAGARAFAASADGKSVMHMPAFWVTVLLLPLLYGTVWIALTNADGFSNEVRAAIASSVVTGILGAVVGFWLGSSFTTSKSRGLGAEANK